MAFKRLTIDGYGQVEINNCAFRRDGRIEAQCAPDATSFSQIAVENGMLLAVDKVNGKVVFATSDSTLPVALVYSAEHGYKVEEDALKGFAIKPGDGFLPREGYLAVGDTWTENCIGYDSTVDSEWTSESAFVSALKGYKATRLYGGITDNGAIVISATAPTVGPVLLVTNGDTTMPDGSRGVQFQVIAD